MASRATSAYRWLFLLLLIGSGSCQRTSYSFQAHNAFYEMPAPRYPDSVATTASGAAGAHTAAEASLPRLGTRGHKPRYKLAPQPASSHLGPAKAASVPHIGRRVAQAAAIYARRRHQVKAASEPERFKSWGIALVLAFLLGGLGVHLGYHGRGVAYLLATGTAMLPQLVASTVAEPLA